MSLPLDDSTVASLRREHGKRRQQRLSQWKEIARLYRVEWWKGRLVVPNQAERTIETADAHAYVETLVSSLYTRAPAVVLGEAPDGAGDAELAEAAVNAWLADQRKAIELVTRRALLYGLAAGKVAATGDEDFLAALRLEAIPPWELLLDEEADRWEDQRYILHVYTLPLDEAKRRWPNRRWRSQPSITDGPKGWQGVQVVEVWTPQGEGAIWSPDLDSGNRWLAKDLSLPACPIVPLVPTPDPERPLVGLSRVWLLRHQFREKNILRTYRAAAVRKDARLYATLRGILDDEAQALLEAGVDGAVLELDLPAGTDLRHVLLPLQHAPVSSNIVEYEQQVDRDIQRGSALSPLTRGEPIRTTATEVTALAAYAANEVGKLARERDIFIEGVAKVWLALATPLLDKPYRLLVQGRRRSLAPADLDADFRPVARDAGATPQSDAARASNLVSMLPTLQALGVPRETLLRELVDVLDLPARFLRDARKARKEAEEQAAKVPARQPGVQVGGDAGVPAQDALQAILAAAGGGGEGGGQ